MIGGQRLTLREPPRRKLVEHLAFIGNEANVLVKDVHSVCADEYPLLPIREEIEITDPAMRHVSGYFKALEGVWNGLCNRSRTQHKRSPSYRVGLSLVPH